MQYISVISWLALIIAVECLHRVISSHTATCGHSVSLRYRHAPTLLAFQSPSEEKWLGMLLSPFQQRFPTQTLGCMKLINFLRIPSEKDGVLFALELKTDCLTCSAVESGLLFFLHYELKINSVLFSHVSVAASVTPRGQLRDVLVHKLCVCIPVSTTVPFTKAVQDITRQMHIQNCDLLNLTFRRIPLWSFHLLKAVE